MPIALKISDMTSKITQIMANHGLNHNLVVVMPSKEKNVAYCVGLCLNNVSAPLFNLIGKVAAGFIVIK